MRLCSHRDPKAGGLMRHRLPGSLPRLDLLVSRLVSMLKLGVKAVTPHRFVTTSGSQTAIGRKIRRLAGGRCA